MRLKNAVSWAMSVAVIGTFTGCASVPMQAFEKKDAAPVRKIALLQIEEPPKYLIHNIGGAAMAFGLIGGLAQAADGISKTDRFTQQMKEQKVALGEQMAQTVAEALEKEGYEVVYLSNQRPKIKEDNKADYSQIQTDADAILDVGFLVVGYLSPSESPDYQPWIRTAARLVSTKDASVRYVQVLNYGAKLKYSSEKIENLPAEAKYAYGNFDILMTNSKQAAEGITEGIAPISRRIAEQLR
jgi:hypothetical protein